MKKPHQKAISQTPFAEYGGLIGGIAELLEAARRTAARTVNALMTATYWEIGRRIVEFEQQGAARAGYGEQILSKLSQDLTARFGRGFGRRNLFQIRAFYLAYRSIVQTSSAQLVKEHTVCKIRRSESSDTAVRIRRTKHFRITVSEIAPNGLPPRAPRCRLSAALVALSPAAFHEDSRGAPIL